jgi:hypothetical protein
LVDVGESFDFDDASDRGADDRGPVPTALEAATEIPHPLTARPPTRSAPTPPRMVQVCKGLRVMVPV